MKKKFILFSFILLTLTLFSSPAMSIPILNTVDENHVEDVQNKDGDWEVYDEYQNSGVFLGLYDSNDGTDTLEDILSDYYDDEVSLEGSDVTVTINGWDGSELIDAGTDVNKVDIANGEYLSGTWNTSPSTSLLSFYTVKANNYFALYLVDPEDNTGSWSTFDIFNDKDKNGFAISHYTGVLGGITAVPEPTGILLFGLGLLCFADRLRKIQLVQV